MIKHQETDVHPNVGPTIQCKDLGGGQYQLVFNPQQGLSTTYSGTFEQLMLCMDQGTRQYLCWQAKADASRDDGINK